MWDVVLVSASSQELANAACDSLCLSSPDVRGAKLLAVADPSKEASVGSGGAVINAMLVMGEELSARSGLTSLSVKPFATARIILLQIANVARGGSPHPCLPQALTAVLAAVDGEIASGVCHTLHVASLLYAGMPPGLVIASTDSIIAAPADVAPLSFDAPSAEAVAGLVLTVPLPLEQARAHGVCVPVAPPSGAHGRVVPTLGHVLYRGTDEQLAPLTAPDGTLAVYTGSLYLTAATAVRLLELHVRSPLDACTCLGIDSGTPPLKLDLHADVLAPLAATEEGGYLQQRSHSHSTGGDEAPDPRWLSARRVLWAGLRGEGGAGGAPSELGGLRLCCAVGCGYHYLSSPSAHQALLLQPPLPPTLSPASRPAEEDQGVGDWRSPARPPKPSSPRLLSSFLAPDTAAAWPEGSTPPPVALGSLLSDGVRVGSGCALVHCSLPPGTQLGEGTFLYGVSAPPSGCAWPSRLIAHEVALSGCSVALLLRHADDSLHTKADDPTATFLARPWEALLKAGATSAQLWPSQGGGGGGDGLGRDGGGLAGNSLWSAKLFPVLSAEARKSEWGLASWWRATRWLFRCEGGEMAAEEWASWERTSFAEACARVDVRATVASQQMLARDVALTTLRQRLMLPETQDVRPQIKRLACGSDGALASLLSSLDGMASGATAQMAARAFAAIAEALAMRAGNGGGLRSGPACNAEWVGALRLLREGRVAEATAALAAVRGAWVEAGEPRMLVRAARHYEGAMAECISLCVRSCEVGGTTPEAEVPRGAWVVCEAPCRVDLAGGWSDTPPICYEHSTGGLVVNAAITVGGRCPIGAKCRRIVAPVVRISVDDGATFLEVHEVHGLSDYNSPLAPGALPKTVLLFCGLVSLHPPDGASLAAQLEAAGGGIELISWSRLPTGSGLGTSSILAGVLVSCVGRAMGRVYSTQSLTHAVLQVEQMLTTGGGWQDQAGGLLPGIKRCTSPPRLPLSVDSVVLPLPPKSVDLLNAHLALVYTGKTRLARNLLQDVLRRWFSANPAILANVAELVANAGAMEAALLAGDIAEVGACLDRYWAQKKMMCDAEPEAVSRMLAKVRHLVHGATLAGAGGGGFMLLVTKLPHAEEALQAALAEEQCVLHEVAIDTIGLRTRVEPDSA